MKYWFKKAGTQSFAYLLSLPIFVNALILDLAELKRLKTGGAAFVVRANH